MILGIMGVVAAPVLAQDVDARTRLLEQRRAELSATEARVVELREQVRLEVEDVVEAQVRRVIEAKEEAERAKAAREIAEVKLEGYDQGTYHLQALDLKGRLTLAENEASRAQEKVRWASRLDHEDSELANAFERAKLDALRADLGVKKVRMELEMLEHYTRNKEHSALQAEIERAKGAELANQSRLSIEEKELERLRKSSETIGRLNADDYVVGLLQKTLQDQKNVGRLLREAERLVTAEDMDAEKAAERTERIAEIHAEISEHQSAMQRQVREATALADALHTERMGLLAAEAELLWKRRELETLEQAFHDANKE